MRVVYNRKWAMPNKWTFKIDPIKRLVNKYVGDGLGWIDPFAGENSLAEITNDLNPERPTKFHLKAEDFLNQLEGQFNGVLFDPPYSNRQIKEVYESVGLKFTQEDSQGLFIHEKRIAASKIKLGGLAICCGWNSNGFGKNLGFEIVEILLVAHGSMHNDTIVTVERKFSDNLFNQ